MIAGHAWTRLHPAPDFRAGQLLLGHSDIESTGRGPGSKVDDAIEIAEKIDN